MHAQIEQISQRSSLIQFGKYKLIVGKFRIGIGNRQKISVLCCRAHHKIRILVNGVINTRQEMGHRFFLGFIMLRMSGGIDQNIIVLFVIG